MPQIYHMVLFQVKPEARIHTRTVSLSRVKVEAVRLAIALEWSVAKILQFIRGDCEKAGVSHWV